MSAQMKPEDGTHYRKVFDSPYLSSADIVGPTALTIARVTQELDKTKKTKDTFNTAYFVERELRPGEKLKPMILNATNSKVMNQLAGSPFIEDWGNRRVIVYVDNAVRFGKETVEGLRLRIPPSRKVLTPESGQAWTNAKASFKREGNLDKVLAHMDMTQEHVAQLIAECQPQEGAE